MPKTKKKYTKLKAIRVNDEILEKCPKEKTFSGWVKELILNQSEEKNYIFKDAFQELYSIFDQFSKNPTPSTAVQLFQSADLKLIDIAREAITVE